MAKENRGGQRRGHGQGALRDLRDMVKKMVRYGQEPERQSDRGGMGRHVRDSWR